MGEPNDIVLIFASNQLGRVDFRVGDQRYSYSLDGAIVQRVKDMALRRPGAALNLAKERGTLITEAADAAATITRVIKKEYPELSVRVASQGGSFVVVKDGSNEAIEYARLAVQRAGYPIMKDAGSYFVASTNKALKMERTLRSKDSEITNEPSAVADLAWPGSTYAEGVGMKKLDKVLGEAQDMVTSEYFTATLKEDGDDTELRISMSGSDKLRGGIADNRADTLRALKQMDVIVEKLVQMS